MSPGSSASRSRSGDPDGSSSPLGDLTGILDAINREGTWCPLVYCLKSSPDSPRLNAWSEGAAVPAPTAPSVGSAPHLEVTSCLVRR